MSDFKWRHCQGELILGLFGDTENMGLAIASCYSCVRAVVVNRFLKKTALQ